jgi:hypothetical protein
MVEPALKRKLADEITGQRKSSMPGSRMTKRLLVILVLTLLIPALWFTEFRSSAEPPATCDAQYDTLVKQAKADLIGGNRTAAINSLIAARNKLRDCETPSAKDVAPIYPN